MGRGQNNDKTGSGAPLRKRQTKPSQATYVIQEQNGEASLWRLTRSDSEKWQREKLVSFFTVGSTAETLAALGHLAAANWEQLEGDV